MPRPRTATALSWALYAQPLPPVLQYYLWKRFGAGRFWARRAHT